MKNFKLSTKTTIIGYTMLISVIFFGCEDRKITVESTSKGGQVKAEGGFFTHVTELNEFEYKGHTYISCYVRDGIALTHAGHCWCNGSKK